MDIIYVGLDWGSENHAVCVMRSDGSIQAERSLRNDGRFVELLVELVGVELGAAKFAVESRELPIVDMLVEAGAAVFTINPKQSDQFRSRESVSGAKDDRRDARVLAGALRTDAKFFRRVEALSSTAALLHVRARAVVDLDAQFRVAANQLRAVLVRYFPAVLTLCDGADERWLWRLLDKAATPALAAKLTARSLQAVLDSCQVRRFDASRIKEVIGVQHLTASPGVVLGCVEQVHRLTKRLELLRAQKSAAESLRDQAVKALDAEQRAVAPITDVELVAAMPGDEAIGQIRAHLDATRAKRRPRECPVPRSARGGDERRTVQGAPQGHPCTRQEPGASLARSCRPLAQRPLRHAAVASAVRRDTSSAPAMRTDLSGPKGPHGGAAVLGGGLLPPVVFSLALGKGVPPPPPREDAPRWGPHPQRLASALRLRCGCSGLPRRATLH